MHGNLVERWFGNKFCDLHPLLQELHVKGGSLSGSVSIEIPTGLAGLVGARMAKKIGLPTNGGDHHLMVTISHHADGLHWDRRFDGLSCMQSIFKPHGNYPEGFWIESTDVIKLFLTVDVLQGGWHWRCLKIKIGGISVPLWLLPRSHAFKTIEEGKYRFYVGFSLPFLGTILSYSGLLEPVVSEVANV